MKASAIQGAGLMEALEWYVGERYGRLPEVESAQPSAQGSEHDQNIDLERAPWSLARHRAELPSSYNTCSYRVLCLGRLKTLGRVR